MFLSTGLQAFADKDIPTTSISVTYKYNTWGYKVEPYVSEQADYYHSGSDFTALSDRGYVDVSVTIDEQFSFDPATAYNPNVNFIGFFQSYGTFKITATGDSYTNILAIIYQDENHNIPYDYLLDGSNVVNTTVTNGRSYEYRRNTIFYFTDSNYATNASDGPIYNRSKYYFRIYYSVNGVNSPNVSVNVNMSKSPTGRGVVRSFKSEENILYNSKLDLDQLVTIFSNDTSGVSDNVNSAASTAAAAEEAADTAISSALPSADAQLDSIAAYDYNSIHTDNSTAFSFWKSLGDYILSNSNLRGIGALLILCLFLGFVVFLLRL